MPDLPLDSEPASIAFRFSLRSASSAPFDVSAQAEPASFVRQVAMLFTTLPESSHELVSLRPVESSDLQDWYDYLSMPAVFEHTRLERPFARRTIPSRLGSFDIYAIHLSSICHGASIDRPACWDGRFSYRHPSEQVGRTRVRSFADNVGKGHCYLHLFPSCRLGTFARRPGPDPSNCP